MHVALDVPCACREGVIHTYNSVSNPLIKLPIMHIDSYTSPHHNSTHRRIKVLQFGPGFSVILSSVRPLPTIRVVILPCVITASAAGGAAGLRSFPSASATTEIRESNWPVPDQNTNNGQEAQKAQVRKTRI